jgi:formamidopyrimidine-DNA glycosylase
LITLPELPEVETIRLTLEPKLLQHQITGGEVLLPKLIVDSTPADFLQKVTGQKITAVERRGKYLLLKLAGKLVLAIHLRMTGRLTVCPVAGPLEKATYLRLTLDDGHELRFCDQRKFGKVLLFPENSLPPGIGKLGPEPLHKDFSPKILAGRLGNRALAIKKALLNQDIIAGLGNIYTDEALFLAGIHPARPSNSLTLNELQALYKAIRHVLSEGIEHHGTTKQHFCDGEGKPGSHQEYLRVYGRKGQPCLQCGSPIVKMNFGGRGTHFCPICQR